MNIRKKMAKWEKRFLSLVSGVSTFGVIYYGLYVVGEIISWAGDKINSDFSDDVDSASDYIMATKILLSIVGGTLVVRTAAKGLAIRIDQQDRLDERVEGLERENKNLYRIIADLDKQNKALEQQVDRLTHTSTWTTRIFKKTLNLPDQRPPQEEDTLQRTHRKLQQVSKLHDTWLEQRDERRKLHLSRQAATQRSPFKQTREVEGLNSSDRKEPLKNQERGAEAGAGAGAGVNLPQPVPPIRSILRNTGEASPGPDLPGVVNNEALYNPESLSSRMRRKGPVRSVRLSNPSSRKLFNSPETLRTRLLSDAKGAGNEFEAKSKKTLGNRAEVYEMQRVNSFPACAVSKFKEQTTDRSISLPTPTTPLLTPASRGGKQ